MPVAGTLIVAWLTERDEVESPLAFVIALPTRALVVPDARPGARVPFELPIPAELDEVLLAVWLDHAHQGLDTLDAAPSLAELASPRHELHLTLPTPAAAEPAPERCAGERRELVQLSAPQGSGRVCVMLPASYAQGRGHYPVIYALPGLGGGDVNGIAEAVRRLLDEPESGLDAIVVGIDARTTYGSSYFVRSPLTGDWESYVQDVVAEIDRRYRTRATTDGRAVIGHSTGGFNAISIAMRHPTLFGAVAASSPDALDLEAWLLTEDGRHARSLWLSWMRFEDRLGPPGQFASYAAEWSPDPSMPRGYAWPIDLETGEVRDVIWGRWRAQSPITWLDDPEGLARARRLSGRIFLTCGTRDEPLLFAPTERYAGALSRLGIDHVWVPTELGHGGDGRERFMPMLRFLAERLTPAPTPRRRR